MVYFDMLTSFALIDALGPSKYNCNFFANFCPQVTKFGLTVSTNKRIKVKKYEAIIL